MANFESKILKKKKLDKDVSLLVTQNRMSGRIFVEFSSETSKLKLQKSFQNTIAGTQEAKLFQESIKSIADLRRYFGLENR